MNDRSAARLAIMLLLAAMVALSLTALAQSDDLADRTLEPV